MNRKSASKSVIFICMIAPLLLQVNCGSGGGSDDELTTSVSGRIVSTDENGLPGIYVKATGYIPTENGCTSRTVSQETATDNRGSYTFVTQEVGDTSGDVRIEPHAPDYAFDPAAADLYVGYGEHRRGVDFTGYKLFDLSGALTGPSFDDLAGTTILVEGSGSQQSSQVSSTGEYLITRLREGDYMVTPSSPYFKFDPPQRLVSSPGTDLTDINFTATPKTFEISGAIFQPQQNLGFAGVRVLIEGSSITEVTTDQVGRYHVPGLIRGEYQITPVQSGYYFAPESQTVWLDTSDRPDVDFSANYINYALTGRVVDEAGAPLSRVAIRLDGLESTAIRTGDNGSYQIPGLTLGVYELTPATVCPAFDFSPPSRVFGVSGGLIPDQNFTAIRTDAGGYSISGRVIEKSGNGLPGIPIALDGIIHAATVTDMFGDFQFPGLMSGPYTVSVGENAYNLGPLSREINLCSMDSTNNDFREIATWKSSGYLAARGTAIHGTADGDFVVALDGTDIRVIKINGRGDPLWLKTYQGDQDEMATAVTGLSAGGSLIAGRIQSPAAITRDGLLMKLGETGDVLWAKILHGTADLLIRSVLEMNDGGYLLAGTLGANTKSTAGVLLKTDADGSFVWQYELPALPLDHMLLTTDGRIVVVGGKVVTALTPFGEILWARSYEFGEWQASLKRIVPTGINEFYVAGTITNPMAYPVDSDHFVMRIGSAGELIWSRRIGNPTPEYAAYAFEEFSDAQPSTSGGLLYIGVRSYDQNNSGARILELDSQGDLLRFKDRGDMHTSHIISSLVRADGDRFISAGYYGWSTLTSAYTLELTKLDAREDTCDRHVAYALNVNPLAGAPVDRTMAPPLPGQIVGSEVALTATDLTADIPDISVCGGVNLSAGDL